MKTILNYIQGELTPPASGRYLDNDDPSTGKVYSQCPDSDAADIERAVSAAEAAFPTWAGTPVEKRARLLMKIADLIDANADRLAEAECIDNGKPITLARKVDIPRAAYNFRFFAGAIQHASSEAHMTDGLALNYTQRRPRGVAGLISPWNLPLYLLTWKVAPALATGNTAVAKPSEVTPMTAFLLSELCIEAGLPPGVLNIVHGRGAEAGAALVAHPRVPTISFTGGTVTGAGIASTCAPMFKRLSLELGGKNPNVIFADADMDQALAVSLRSSFLNQGQICLCGSRILVERPAFETFVGRLVEGASKLAAGDPLDAATEHGAMVSRPHMEKVLRCIDLAREEGGEVLCGGGRTRPAADRCAEGYFIAPTVITGLGASCRTNQEEIFGPVVTVAPFDKEDEAVASANDTRYGLSATVWTRDLARAHRVAGAIQSGTVWVNCWLLRDLRVPFGGMKQSGMGREGGEDSMHFFTEPKNVCIGMRE